MDELPANFTHLHVHSHYSLLGGTSSVTDLAARAAGDGLSALALTDTNGLYGAVALKKACRQFDIRPILGMTVPIAISEEDLAAQATSPGLVVLLAKNEAGYRSLCRVSSWLQADANGNHWQKQGLPLRKLRDEAEGLFCLEGGRRGWATRFLRLGNRAAAARYISRLTAVFQESCFVGLERHPNLGRQERLWEKELVQVGKRFGLGAAAVQPVYCLEAEERADLRLLAAIGHNCRLEEVTPAMMPDEGETAVSLHWLPPEEMLERFNDMPEALTNVASIVKQCGEVLPNGRSIWPIIKLPEGQTPAAALAEWAEVGLNDRYPDGLNAAGRARLEKELAAINRHGFASLFLIVADIVGFARQTDVPVNTRGSVANSLVAYAVGITNVDPLAHDLLFERFLNPARANLPDIDLDFCSRRRDEVLGYVRETYGADQVALVATISTMKPKSAVRETAKAYGLDDAQIKRIAGFIPSYWHHPDPRRREETPMETVLRQLDDAQEKEVVRAAFRIEGQPHHLSVHPGGIVITPGPLTDYVPIQMAPKGFLITQYDHQDVEVVGLPKIDLLGIRALTVLADAAELIREHHEPTFRLADIRAEDKETGSMVARADTIGVFQCESTGAMRTLRQLRAKNVADLAVANAFFKPGPATGGMAKSFVKRYRGEAAVAYLHPALEPILSKTQGVLLFQEQILRIAREIAGLSWEEADHLRRGMSKFKAREMAAMRTRFVVGCQHTPEPVFTVEQAETLWQQVMAFAGYGFNQGHATAYAEVSYQSAYLKAYWPAAFLCARLADHGGFHHQAIYVAEAQRLGIKVLPPHVNFSGRKFALVTDKRDEDYALFMGLGQVRDLRRQSVREIVAKRPFSSLRDLLATVSLQKKEVIHLIQCGALDGVGESRAAMLADAQGVARAGNVRQLSFGFATETAVAPETVAERAQWEKHLLGYPVSVQPAELVHDVPEGITALTDLPQTQGRLVSILGWRLAGWTGGKGFYVGNGRYFVLARWGRDGTGKEQTKKPWLPMVLNGRWRVDEWGGGWFQVDSIEKRNK